MAKLHRAVSGISMAGKLGLFAGKDIFYLSRECLPMKSVDIKMPKFHVCDEAVLVSSQLKSRAKRSNVSCALSSLDGDKFTRPSAVAVDSPVEAEEPPVLNAGVSEELEQAKIETEPVPEPECNYKGTQYVPVYVMLPLGTISAKNKVADPKGLKKDFKTLKSIGVDGVMVDCWWGIVERKIPQKYNWFGYRHLFNMVRDVQLKLQVVMSFHQCGGNVGDDVYIPLPQWVLDIGRENPDIFFTDRNGIHNPECLTWGADKEPVLRGRTPLEVYYDYMRSFRQEFSEFLEDGTITEIEVGMGACGELRYPSYPESLGWAYPGMGEFQCYDKYLMTSLKMAAEAQGHPDWAVGPANAGYYNSRPQDTEFFRDGGDYDSPYGHFFLKWYSQTLIEHGDRLLTFANLVFEDVKIAAKVSGIHWWYKTASHAAELVAGFYNTSHRNGYRPIANMLAKHKATFNFTCVELCTADQTEDYPEALADPEGLVWQVLNSAWDAGIAVASENALSCFERKGFNKILENAKPSKDPDGRHLAAFTYLRLNAELMEKDNFSEFMRFVRQLHGETIEDLMISAEEPVEELISAEKTNRRIDSCRHISAKN